MIELGTKAPDFTLLDTITGKERSLSELKSSIATVIIFICNHCPFVQHMQKELVDVATTYQDQGIQFIAINSNDVAHYPDDAPEKMQAVAKQFDYPFPYLFDETQEIAKAYQATCTPDFFVFDADLNCVYRGRFDESRPGKDIPVTGKDLCEALDNILLEKPISEKQHPSMGCNIKWK